jgi:thiol:disulfide interchange protein
MKLQRRWFLVFPSALILSLYLAGAAPFRAQVHASGLEANGPPTGAPQAAKGGPDDPFDSSNRVHDESAPATPKATAAAVKKLDASPIDDRIEFKISFEPEQARRGETVKMTIAGQLKPGYHTYPMTKRSAAQGPDGQLAQDALGLSRLVYEDSPGLKPLWPVKESEPMFENEEGSGWMLEHKSDFTWTQDILILPDAQPGTKHLRFKIVLQVCDKTCILGQPSFDVPITVTDAPALALTGALQDRLKVKQQAIEDVPPPDSLPGNLNPNVVGTLPEKNKPDSLNGKQETASKPSSTPVKNEEAKLKPPAPKAPPTEGLLAFILQGIVFGGISLVTPCVFPMIPITVSFFLKQSEKEHHKPLGMALVYSGTIVAVLTIGGVLLSAVLQKASLHWATNFVLGALFIYFALSLFGMYEIRLPTGLLNLTSAQEGRGGLLGTVFMALTFTIISFTCVAPFYGGFIGLQATAASASDWLRLCIGALAFSMTFASPFFFLALVPGLLRSLPKSGSWMNTIKVVMAFLEIAAALKFLRSGELAVFGQASILSYDLVLGLYVALAFLCGLYLLGVYRLPHDHEPVQHIGVLRLLFSLFFLGLGIYMMPGLFRNGSAERQRPAGTVFAWLDSFLLQDPADQYAGAAANGGAEASRDGNQMRLVWLNDVHAGLKEALEQKRLVFIDFTGLI